MKVALLTSIADQRGGGELMLSQLLEHGRRSDVQWVVIFLEQGPLVREYQRMGVRTVVVEAGRLRHVHRLVLSSWSIAAILRREQVDLLVSWSAKPHLYGSMAALLAGVPSAWYQLGYPVGRHLSLLDRVATWMPARAILALSRVGAEAQKRLWPHRPVHLVYPGVELSRFDPSRLPPKREVRRQLGLPEKATLVGIVGRLQRWKGMHVLIEAMPYILQQYPDARCVVVGGDHKLEPDYPEHLRALVDAHGMHDKVIFAGFQKNVPQWMQAMDVMVHASDDEPFGIVVIEAMALGKPVVATDTAGPSEIITHGVDGLLTPFGDAEQLAGRIIHYLDHPDVMREAGRAARTRAMDFAPETYAANVIAAFHTLAKPGA